MKNIKEMDKKTIVIVIVSILVIIAGFLFIKGMLKKKDSEQISETEVKSEIELSKDCYEIIKNKNIKEKNEYVVKVKQKLTNSQLTQLTNEVVKDTTQAYKLYIFDDEENATNFDKSEEDMQIVVTPKEEKIQIQTYYTIDDGVSKSPKGYTIKSVETKNNITNIEITVDEAQDPESMLNEAKILGENIKKLNSKKNIEKLSIKINDRSNENAKWTYKSENKNTIIKTEIVEL